MTTIISNGSPLSAGFTPRFIHTSVTITPLQRSSPAVESGKRYTAMANNNAVLFSMRQLHLSPLPRAPPSGTTMYQCGDCGKSFRLLNALNHHIMTKHAGNAKAMMMKDGKLEPVAASSGKGSSSSASPATTTAPGMTSSATAASSMAAGFPGVFSPFGGGAVGGTMGPVPPAATTAATATSTQNDTALEPGETTGTGSSSSTEDDKSNKSVFVCTICQKTFRLEAALQHHYQAKHNISAPSVSPSGSGTTGAAGGGDAAGKEGGSTNLGGGLKSGLSSSSTSSVADDATKAPVSMAEYVRQQEAELPSAPQYHLDVAPNAPEEGDVAVHWRCVNFCVLMGSLSDVTEGYVFEDHVLQFTVATHFEGPSPGDPDRDFHLVRVYDENFWRPIKESLREGDTVLVNGRLRMVPQYDSTLRKYYHHPVVQVFPGSGLVVKS